jgi:hypothetical protein
MHLHLTLNNLPNEEREMGTERARPVTHDKVSSPLLFVGIVVVASSKI